MQILFIRKFASTPLCFGQWEWHPHSLRVRSAPELQADAQCRALQANSRRIVIHNWIENEDCMHGCCLVCPSSNTLRSMLDNESSFDTNKIDYLTTFMSSSGSAVSTAGSKQLS